MNEKVQEEIMASVSDLQSDNRILKRLVNEQGGHIEKLTATIEVMVNKVNLLEAKQDRLTQILQHNASTILNDLSPQPAPVPVRMHVTVENPKDPNWLECWLNESSSEVIFVDEAAAEPLTPEQVAMLRDHLVKLEKDSEYANGDPAWFTMTIADENVEPEKTDEQE